MHDEFQGCLIWKCIGGFKLMVDGPYYTGQAFNCY